MVPAPCLTTAPVPPPSYQRAVQKQPRALHRCALTLVTSLHLLDRCRLAVRLAQRRCPPPLPAGPGGAPRVYAEESLLLIVLVRILWRLSFQDMHDWLTAWPALARACGLPTRPDGTRRIPARASNANASTRRAHRRANCSSSCSCVRPSRLASVGRAI